MIITKIQGGLGNQMFQFAIACIFAQKRGISTLIDTNLFNNTEKQFGFTPRTFEISIFNNSYTEVPVATARKFLKLSIVNKIKRELGFNYPKTYTEKSLNFDKDLLSTQAPVYLNGYFQSYKYYFGYENLIKNIFSFPIEKLDSVNEKLLLKIKNSNSLSLHIRRGDYVKDKKTQQFHGNCSVDYYQDAIALIARKEKDVSLFFFSDDSEWVKNQFKDLSYPKTFVDHNKSENSWKDMFLMSSCKHNIIANSSFSWWAAWLNTNAKKTIIAPKNWYASQEIKTNDLIPSEWIRL